MGNFLCLHCETEDTFLECDIHGAYHHNVPIEDDEWWNDMDDLCAGTWKILPQTHVMVCWDRMMHLIQKQIHSKVCNVRVIKNWD